MSLFKRKYHYHVLQPTTGTCSYSKRRKSTIECNRKQEHIRKKTLKPSVTLYLFLKSEKVQPHKKTQYEVKSKMGISEKLKRKQFITDVIKSQLPIKTLRMCNQMYRENDQNIF